MYPFRKHKKKTSIRLVHNSQLPKLQSFLRFKAVHLKEKSGIRLLSFSKILDFYD